MSVEWVKLKRLGVSGESEGRNNPSPTYTAIYLAKCDSNTDSPKTVMRYLKQNGTQPWNGRRLKYFDDIDQETTCTSIVVNAVDGSEYLYTIQAKFEADKPQDEEKDKADGEGRSTDPLDWHDEIDIGWTSTSEPVEKAIFHGWKDINGNRIGNRFMREGDFLPIMNSALVPFDPGIEEALDIKVLRFVKNIPEWNGNIANQWQGAVNSDQVNIVKPLYKFTEVIGPLTGKIVQFGGQFQYRNGIAYYRRTIEVHVSPKGWRRFLVDRGLNARAARGDADGKGDVIYDEPESGASWQRGVFDPDGYPAASPVLLDGDGQPLKLTKPPVFGEFQTIFERPFNGIDW